MPGENIQDWSTTAANNATADSAINWAEGQTRASVNNSSRSEMAAHAKDRNLNNGSITTGGAANAQTFTSGVTYTGTVPTGLRAKLKIGVALTNTAAATLNMDGIGAVTIKTDKAADLAAGDLVAGTYRDFLYNGTNWILLAASSATTVTGFSIRKFTTSSTYPTPTNGNVVVLVYCKGGGGGGNSSTAVAHGGGGGEGAESWKLTTAAALSGQTVTIGAGGTSNGGTGGTTSVGAVITAPGGSGGSTGDLGGQGGAGGSGGTNDWGMPGDCGHSGATAAGAALIYSPGGGKGGGTWNQNGVANSGGGGGGGSNVQSGGTGGTGIVVCIEYGAI